MLRRVAGWAVVGSGLATGTLLAAAAVYFVVFALSGGLQTSLATDAPPEWALYEFAVLSGLVILYLVAAGVFTVSLAVLQLHSGPWWVVVAGLSALAASAGWLLVAGNQTGDVTYARIDTLGFVAYMAAANFVGLRARQLKAVTAGLGVSSTLLLLAASVPGGLAAASIVALAVLLYGVWVVWVGLSSRRRPAVAAAATPSPAVLQTEAGAR